MYLCVLRVYCSTCVCVSVRVYMHAFEYVWGVCACACAYTYAAVCVCVCVCYVCDCCNTDVTHTITMFVTTRKFCICRVPDHRRSLSFAMWF